MSIVQRLLDRLGLAPDTFDDDDVRLAAEQAVVDLLELVMLVDGSSAEAERELIRQFLDERQWPGGHNPYSYSEEACARARLALAPGGPLDEFLATVTGRLATDDDRAAAYAAVLDLAGVDGELDEREARLLAGLRSRFEAR
ncbi:MAG: hypothetical protein H0W25_18705 [Acidimicrobiia bacterium]|nr:hypothetical protein [Acidimicrobiia bacterium]